MWCGLKIGDWILIYEEEGLNGLNGLKSLRGLNGLKCKMEIGN